MFGYCALWSWSEKTDQNFTPNAVSPQNSLPLIEFSLIIFIFIFFHESCVWTSHPSLGMYWFHLWNSQNALMFGYCVLWRWSEKTDQTFTPNAVSPQQSLLSHPIFVFTMLQYDRRIILLDILIAYSTLTQLWLVIICKCYLSKYSKSNMDSQNIKGPQDYHKYYHRSTEDLIWLDWRGNPILFLHTLCTHVEAINPIDSWSSIQTRNKVHTVPAHRNGPSSSTAIDPNTHPLSHHKTKYKTKNVR